MNVRQRILGILYYNLFNEIHMGTAAERLQDSINVCGSSVTLIVDGFEREVGVSTNNIVKSKCYSTKKKQHLFNTLVVVSPSGYIRYISHVYGGVRTDNEITAQEIENMGNFLVNEETMIGD